ncbi:MAG: hypothetical protein Q8K55_07645 [Gemmatimonadaceae bacterium]|nr:hypothetical protein [Gemmatimonadaceae bacterium]
MTLPAWSLPAMLGVAALALITWNFAHGARLAALHSAGRPFRVLSGLGAFLFLPALVIAFLAPSAPGARVLGPLVWLWPLVTVGVAVQAAWALKRGSGSASASALIAAPIAAFDVLVAWVAVTRWMDGMGGALPEWALAPGMAVSTLAAAAFGTAVFPWAAALLMPVLVPAAPARQRATRAMRALMAIGSTAALSATLLAVPRAHAALRSTQALRPASDEAPARGEFAIGVRLFGTLTGPPSAATARHHMALADSLGVTALHVELAPGGTSVTALDSVARSIEPRRDSLLLVVTLTLNGSRAPIDGAEGQRHQAMIERVVRRLRPDVLVPAERVTTGSGAPSLEAWRDYYERAAATVRRADRRVTVALATDASTTVDSALTDWVMQGGSTVRAVALSVQDHGARPARVVDALNALARWASLARVVPDAWILGVPAAPGVTGEVVQQRLVRHALAWGAAHPWVRGIIAGDAGDVTAPTGLRTATGRARRALAEVGGALRAQRDTPAAPPPAVVPVTPVMPVAPASTPAAGRIVSPDTFTPPSR